MNKKACKNAESLSASCPVCLPCNENGNNAPATYFAQQDSANGNWDWIPVCESHASDWWEGSDYPDGLGGPPLFVIAPA